MKTAVAEIRPAIDYPKMDETIGSREYTLRIAAPDTVEVVDVSIDQGPWLPCRKDVGYWWYDWSGYADGAHEIIARTRAASGRWRMSVPLEINVEIAAE